MLARIISSFFLICLFCGCSVKPYAHITSQVAPDYIALKTDKVCVFTSDNAGIAEQQFNVMLRSEMRSSGINVIDSIVDADYVAFSELNEKTKSGTAYMYMPDTSTTSGYIGRTAFTASSTSSELVPYHYTHTKQEISIYLHRKSDLIANKKRTVWEGKLDVDQDDYKKNSAVFVRELLKFFGSNHDGETMVDVPKR